MTRKFYPIDNFFFSLTSLKFFLIKNTFQVTLHNFFNVFLLFNTVSSIKLNFKLKIDPKMFILKTLKKFEKYGLNFENRSGNPASILV